MRSPRTWPRSNDPSLAQTLAARAMRITRVETWAVPVEQEIPYTVAYGDFAATTLVFIRIATDGELIGYGSAGCDVEVTGETAETVLAAINEIAAPIVHGGNPWTHLQL